MQSFIIIIGVILIALILLAYYFQERHYRNIDTLNALKVDVFNDSVDDLFVQADEVKFSGSSEYEFNQVRKQWDQVQELNYPSIENTLFQAEKAVDVFRLFKADRLEKQAEEWIDRTNKEIISVKNKVNRFLEAAEDNQEGFAKMQDKYRSLRRELLTESYKFGPTVQGLDQKLQTIENQFDQFAINTSKGDHVKARQYLEKVSQLIKSFAQEMKVIPHYLTQLNQNYSAELEELKAGYRQLRSKNMAFKNDSILDDIETVKKECDHMHQYVAELNLSEAEKEMQRIESNIDQLYDLMESEFQAQQKVKGQFSQLSEIFQVLYERNRQIKIETDRLSQLYHLDDDILSYGAKNSQAIAESENAFDRLRSDVSQNEVVYSHLSDTVDIVFNKTQGIYDRQQEFLDFLYGMGDEEKKIKAEIDDFAHRMSQITQRLDRSNLPGARDEFYDLYYYTTNRIKDLAHELDQVRLDMGEVRYLYEIIKQDVPQLEEECQDMFSYAQATEQLIQRLNKYRSQYPQMEEQMEMIAHYYYTEYNYERAFTLAAKTLQRIAPHEMESFKERG